MHVWTALTARELALLTILALLGAGPAAYLPSRFDLAGRLASAPILGFCVGTCWATTLLQFAPTGDTDWQLIPLAVISVAVAAHRAWGSRRSRPGRAALGDAGAILLIILAVAGPLTYTLHEHHTVGPTAYTYTDVANYIAEQDGAVTLDLPAARARWQAIERGGPLPTNLEQFPWTFIADLGSNLDAAPLDSNVNVLLGLQATDTNAPFLIVLLLMGALAAFAAVRYFSRSRTWMAVVTGCLFGGPMFLELYFDSYQAAIIAIGMTVPLIAIGHSAAVTRRRGDLIILALLLATMLTVYPLFIALFVALAGIALLWRGVESWRAREPIRPLLRPLATSLAALAAMTIVFDLVAFTRDLRYYRSVLSGTLTFPRVGYHLPLSVLPGWIAQTREFWFMPPLGSADAKQIFLGAALPIVFVGFIVLGLRRNRPAVLLVVMAGVCVAFAEYSFVSEQSCTYCAERDLLPLTPLAATLIGLGLASLAYASARWIRAAGVLGAAVVIVAVGQRARVELIRFGNGSYFLDSGNRALLAKLPVGRGRVQEEGFGLSLYAQAEQPLVYHLIAERTGGRGSVILGSDAANAIQYLDFGPLAISGPQFDPDYRYVLTRLGGVVTDRRTIARAGGGLALQERVRALDITPYSGLALPLVRLEGAGQPSLAGPGPMQFLIAGSDGDRPVWARLIFRTSVHVAIPHQAGVRVRATEHALVVCVRARGQAPARTVDLTIDAALLPGRTPDEPNPPAVPPRGVVLTGMRAVSGTCRD